MAADSRGDADLVAHLFKVHGLVSAGLEPVDGEMKVRQCVICHQLTSVPLHQRVSSLICSNCRQEWKWEARAGAYARKRAREDRLIEKEEREVERARLLAALDEFVRAQPPQVPEPTPPPKQLQLFWVSWIQPLHPRRPYARPAQVLAWWCWDFVANGKVVNACVAAETAKEAMLAICEGWPESPEWQACEAKPLDWRPNATRFPIGPQTERQFASLLKERGPAVGPRIRDGSEM